MKGLGRITRIFLVAIILAGGAYWYINKDQKKTYEVVKWENIYNESNLDFFYENNNEVLIESLDKTYSITELVKDENDRHELVLKLVRKVREIIEVDDVQDSNQHSAYGILTERGESRKVSQRDMAIVVRDFIISQGIPCRVGEFRSGTEKIDKQTNYYIVEYWSDVYKKWIMIDFLDVGYFANKKIPCSAIEVLEYKIEDFSYIGNSEKKKYLNHINKSLESYTIAIDNTIARRKSNSYLTYLYKNQSSLSVEFKNKFIEPTIFTQNKALFNKAPENTQIGKDEKAYIILMKKYESLPSDSSQEENSIEIPNDKLTIGAFKDGKIMDSYYIRLNDGEYEGVEKYKEYNFIKGLNKIELSLDGINTIASVEILRNY